MITLLDDYAIHQTAEPLTRPATSDRNFYDRWYFSGFTTDGGVFFEAALGLYPHRRVMDAHLTVLVDGVQHCFHGSRRAPLERTEMQVGPFVLEIEQPMRLQRLRLDDPASGLACDLRFTARSTPGEEPASRLYDGDRLLMHTTRFVQFGRWDGELRIDGRRLPVAQAMGVRDRSWGIRPCGEPDWGAPGILQRAPLVVLFEREAVTGGYDRLAWWRAHRPSHIVKVVSRLSEKGGVPDHVLVVWQRDGVRETRFDWIDEVSSQDHSVSV